METLRQLIFRDLEDGWSQDSDDTPTNETANEKSPFTDRPGAELADPAPGESPGQWGEEPVEAPDPAPSGQWGEEPVEAPDPAPSGQWGEGPVEAPPLEVLHSPVQVVRKGKRSDQQLYHHSSGAKYNTVIQMYHIYHQYLPY